VPRRNVVRNVTLATPQPPLTWSEACERFLQEERIKGWRPRTLKLHVEVLTATRKDLDANGVPNAPSEILREHLVGMIDRMQTSGRKPRTINLRLQSLRQFFRFLKEKGYCANNVAEDLPTQPKEGRIPKALEDHDVDKLLGAPDQQTFHGLRDHTMIVLLLDTGIRLSELIQIELADLNLEKRELRLQHRIKDHEQRIVYLSPASVGALRRYLRDRGSLTTERVFVNRDEKPLCSASFQTRLQVYSQQIGVKVSPHRLRHTFARAWILNGGDPFSLQAILGHSDMNVVRGYVELWGHDVQRQHGKYSPITRYTVK